MSTVITQSAPWTKAPNGQRFLTNFPDLFQRQLLARTTCENLHLPRAFPVFVVGCVLACREWKDSTGDAHILNDEYPRLQPRVHNQTFHFEQRHVQQLFRATDFGTIGVGKFHACAMSLTPLPAAALAQIGPPIDGICSVKDGFNSSLYLLLSQQLNDTLFSHDGVKQGDRINESKISKAFLIHK